MSKGDNDFTGRAEAVTVARCVADVLDAPADSGVIAHVRDKIQTLCDAYPVYAKGDLSSSRSGGP